MADESNNEVATQPAVLDGIGAAFSDSELQVGIGPAGMLEFTAPEAAEGAEDAPENPEASGGTEQATEPVAEAAQPEPQPEVVPKEQYDNLRSMNDRRFNELADKYKALETKLEEALARGGDEDDDFDDDDYDDDESPEERLSAKDRALLEAAQSRELVADEIAGLQARVVHGEITKKQLSDAIPYMEREFALADRRGYDITMSDAFDIAIEQYNTFGPFRSTGSAAGDNGGQQGIPQGATPAPASKPAAPQENVEALRTRAARLSTETSANVAAKDSLKNPGPAKSIKTIDDAMAAAWKEMQAS